MAACDSAAHRGGAAFRRTETVAFLTATPSPFPTPAGGEGGAAGHPPRPGPCPQALRRTLRPSAALRRVIANLTRQMRAAAGAAPYAVVHARLETDFKDMEAGGAPVPLPAPANGMIAGDKCTMD